MLYSLSKVIPVPMRSTYGVCAEDGSVVGQEHASWWQWRGHIFNHQRVSL